MQKTLVGVNNKINIQITRGSRRKVQATISDILSNATIEGLSFTKRDIFWN